MTTPHRPKPWPRPLPGGGFTLIEMVITLAVIGVLLAGMSSAIVLATRALPSHDGPAAAAVASADALHTLRDDLRAATELPAFDATSVTLHLPDRDGDGRPEVVTYAWAGTAGDPLTRAANGNTPVTVLDNVESFALAYTTADDADAFPGATGTSAELELASYFPGGNSHAYPIDGDYIPGFRFTPSLPANADTWRVTRVLVRTDNAGSSSGQATFELTGWDTGLGPDNTIIQSVSVPENNLNAGYNWIQIDFSVGGPFAPGETAALSVQDTSSGAAGYILGNDDGPPANLHESSDGGTTWTVHTADSALDHFVYGTYETTGDDWTLTRQRVTRIDLALAHGGAATTSHRLAVPLPNVPEVADAVWEADFGVDPTTLDAEADGTAEWVYAEAFPATNLGDGYWPVGDALLGLELSNQNFNQPATVSVSIQDVTDDGASAGIELRPERNGGNGGVVRATLGLAAGEQTLTVSGYSAAQAAYVTWCQGAFPADQPVRLQLVMDPAQDAIAVIANGTACGSFVYDTVPVFNTNALISIADNANSGVRIDHLRVVIGGTATITPGATTSGGSGTSGTGGSSSAMAAPEESGTESSKSSGGWFENFFK